MSELDEKKTKTLLQPAGEPPKLFKAGLYGGPGSGKSHTASLCAIGVALEGQKRVAFFDTESSGSDFVKPMFDEAGVELLVLKGRSLKELMAVMGECKNLEVDCLVVDSLTHVWNEIVESYMQKKNISQMEFNNWKDVKLMNAMFVNAFLRAPFSIILCGRAGYEYDATLNDKGKVNFQKGDMKMKAEGETGYEPNIVVELRRGSNNDGMTARIAHIVKDRSRQMDGQYITNPKWDDFLPHWNSLSNTRTPGKISDETSNDMIAPDKEYVSQAQRDAWVAEIKAVYDDKLPGQGAEIKGLKSHINNIVFDVRSFDRMASLDPYTLQHGAVRLAEIIDEVKEFQKKFPDASLDEVKQFAETLKPKPAMEQAETEFAL